MIPIYQTIIDPGKGNCQQAAVASILELPLDEVPNFKLATSFWTACINFIQSKGYTFHYFVYNNRVASCENYSDCFDPYIDKYLFRSDNYNDVKSSNGIKGYFLAGVYSPKYFDPNTQKQITHAVIIDKDFNIVHDPNPNNKEVKDYPLHWLIGYNGIIDIMIID